MTSSMGWARVWATARPVTSPMLRQGAWYPVVSSGATRAVLEVQGQAVALPHHLLEIRERRPERFTVVYRPHDEPNPAHGSVSDVGRVYAVCPSSGSRVRLRGRPEEIQCPTCGHRGTVAWWETG